MKNILRILALMLLVSVSLQVRAFTVGNVNYTVLSETDATVSARALTSSSETTVTLPSTVESNGKTYSVVDITPDGTWGSVVRLTIPPTVKTMKDFADNTKKLVLLNISDLAAFCNISSSGKWNPLAQICNASTQIRLNGQTLSDVVIPEGVTSVGLNFQNYQFVKTLTLPATLKTIDNNAFKECKQLEYVNFAEGLESIGASAFANCESLKEVITPFSTTSIGEGAFNNCNNVIQVNIQGPVAKIPARLFYYCHNLERIRFGYGVVDIMEYAFVYCEKLEEIHFSETVETVGPWSFTFASVLKKVKFPDSLISVGENAFSSAYALETIRFGKNLVSLAPGAFGAMGSTKVYCPVTDFIPGCDGAFHRWGTLYVSVGYGKAYSEAPGWKNFTQINEYDFDASSGIDDVHVDNPDGIDYTRLYEAYSLSGICVGNSIDGLAPGMYVLRQDGVTSKILVR